MWDKIVSKISNRLRIKHPGVRQAIAELFGTYVMVLFADGANTQSNLCMHYEVKIMTIIWGWAMGIMMAYVVTGGVSRGHLNPVASIALACIGKLDWKSLPALIASQFGGAILGSFTVQGVYKDALSASGTPIGGGGGRGRLIIPGPGSVTGAQPLNRDLTPLDIIEAKDTMVYQIIGTTLLLMFISAIYDKRNVNVPKYLTPLCMGFTIFSIGLGFGFNCGYAINPVRDIGPRIVAAILTGSTEPFSTTVFPGWWMPIIGSHIGGFIGILLYCAVVKFHYPPEGALTDGEKPTVEDSESQALLKKEATDQTAGVKSTTETSLGSSAGTKLTE